MSGLAVTNNPRQQSNCKCLIVEDDFFAADVMAAFLRKSGIECDTAETGKIGLEMYLADPEGYSVIFTDVQMPVMDGIEMTKRIRNSGLSTSRSIPIVALSGAVAGDIAGPNGFTRFISKPFKLQRLVGIFNEVLNEEAV